jgi:hypothetical protein
MLRFLVGTLLLLSLFPLARADEQDILLKKEKQQHIQAETEQMVRRLSTMMQVLDFYQLDKAAEKKMLEELAGMLSGLSREQMNEVIRRLDAAARAAGAKEANQELDEAYARHREILTSLKAMLARYDAVKNLDEVADRLDKASRSQLDLHWQTVELIKHVEDRQRLDLHPYQRTQMYKQIPNLPLEIKRNGDAQGDLHLDVARLLKQAGVLHDKLPAEQQERLRLLQERVSAQRLFENFTRTLAKLRSNRVTARGLHDWKAANELQWDLAEELRALARLLRTAPDSRAALRQARDRLDQAIRKQEELRGDTKEQTPRNDPQQPAKAAPMAKLVFPGTSPLPQPDRRTSSRPVKIASQEQALKALEAARKAAELGQKQALLEFDAHDTQKLLMPHAEEAARKVEQAEAAMKDAKTALAKNAPETAVMPQDKAVEVLKQARTDVNRMIAEAEKQQHDPLAALKKAADTVDQLLKEQTTTRDETKDAARDKQNLKLPALAGKQKDLAKRTTDLQQTPAPTKEKTEPTLDKAAKAMTKATKDLRGEKASEALSKQNRAIKALEEARKEIGAQIAEIEKRRHEIAKLEDAAKKLDELARQEGKVADKADHLAQKPAPEMAKELSRQQDQLMPQAKAVGKQIESAAPEAAKKIAEGSKHMDAAKGQIDKNKLQPASKEAGMAAKKLAEAKEAVAKAMENLKGKELADQAALEPNKLDPAAAAQQLTKALEQAEKAAMESKKAEAKAKLDQPGPEQDLAKLQDQLAKKAKQMKLEAAMPAAKAADSLRKAEIPQALEEQQRSLAKLQEAAEKSPAEADNPQKPSLAKPAEAKAGKPLPAEARLAKLSEPPPSALKKGLVNPSAAKNGEAKPGKKAGEAKMNQAAPGQVKAGAPKASVAKAGNSAQPKSTTGKAAQAKAGNTKGTAPKSAQANAGAPSAGKARSAQAGKAGPAVIGKAKAALAKAGEGKAVPGRNGQAKPALAKEMKAAEAHAKRQMQAQAKGAGQAKGGEPQMSAQAKAPGQGEGLQPESAKTSAQLAKAQKALLEATKALTKSQQATQAAMNALAQAQAQAPQGVKGNLQEAGKELAQANQQLAKGTPGPAGQAQGKAAAKLGQALKTLNEALAAMGQPKVQPGQLPTAVASATPPADAQGKDGQPGQGQPKAGQGKGQGQGKKMAAGIEKNQPKGTGDRVADGKVGKSKSQLSEVRGDGSFLHLPPRQRELIRQALSGQLPPEYAALIQQYYVNIARGRPATMPAPAAPPSAKR